MVSITNERASVEALKHILADSYVMVLNIQNVHWNAQGEGFIAIHKHLDEQYEALTEAVDEIAERIRALGYHAPSSLTELLSLSRVQEEQEPIESIKEGVSKLVGHHKEISKLLTEHIEVLDKDNDAGTIDLLTDRVREHDKFAWLLESNL